jgi:hypothetical protein
MTPFLAASAALVLTSAAASAGLATTRIPMREKGSAAFAGVTTRSEPL